MSVKERDPYTGHMTTGHDWNGIKELNTPIPWVLIFFLAATFIFSVVYWILMPTWPSISAYTKGVLELDQQQIIDEQLQQAEASKTIWTRQLEEKTFAEISKDPQLMSIVSESGPALFKDNCAMCHGQQGEGDTHFPRLNDQAWLWGGEPEAIYKTLQVGINSGHPESRRGQMPSFGTTGTLDSEAVSNLVLYVQSLSNPQIGNGSRADELLAVKNGHTTYSTHCLACHGADGTGNIALGAPNLTDTTWLYGGDKQSIHQTIWSGRAGQMPYWEERLSSAQLKLLALYVKSLSDNSEAKEQ